MSLMDRIIFKDYLQQDTSERLKLITRIQSLRINALEESRLKKGGKTKSAQRNLAKRGKKVKDPTAALTKALKGLSPAAIAKLKESYGL